MNSNYSDEQGYRSSSTDIIDLLKRDTPTTKSVTLYAETALWMYYYARRLSRGIILDDELEDVVQESLLSLLKAYNGSREGCHLKNLAACIVKRRTIDFMRMKRLGGISIDDIDVASPTDDVGDDTQIELTDLEYLIRNYIGRLDGDDHKIVMDKISVITGDASLTWKEIAAETSWSVEAARQRWCRHHLPNLRAIVIGSEYYVSSEKKRK